MSELHDFDPSATRQPDQTNYPGAAVDVQYDRRRCIHAAECGRGLHEVFDAERDCWIDPDAASVEAVVAVVERCPTGALTYIRKDGGPEESIPTRNEAIVSPAGPVYLRGRVRVGDGDAPIQTRVALCRCGASKIKPYCDGSHRKADFRDAGPVAEDPASEEEPGAGELVVSAFPDGPVRVKGPLTLRAASGRVASRGDQIFLCRCGQSGKRPFCDGTHKRVGFKSEPSG